MNASFLGYMIIQGVRAGVTNLTEALMKKYIQYIIKSIFLMISLEVKNNMR